MKKKKVLVLAVFAVIVLMLTACSLGGGERVLYVKVSEFTIGSDVVTLVHEYRAELKEGNSLELEYYTEDKLVCTLEKVSGGGAKLSFSAPLLSDEGNEGTVISLKNGKAAYASTGGNSKGYRYEFSITEIGDDEAVTEPVENYSHEMDVVSYTKYLSRVFFSAFSENDSFSDYQLLSAARYFCAEYGDDIENPIVIDKSGQITVPAESMGKVVQNLFGVERDLSEYANEVEKYGDYYLEYDKVYKFFEETEAWYYTYKSAMSENDVLTVSETPAGVSVRFILDRYTDEESINLGNFVIKQDVEYFFDKYVADGFLYYRLKEVKLHGVESDPISLDDVQILEEKGTFSVRGAPILLSTYSTNNVYSIFVDDVTGDGENDVIAKLYGGRACVLDGYTMELYYPQINLSESVALYDNDEELRIWTEDEVYSIPKDGMAISGDDHPYTDREKISVENGKIRFSSSLVINSAGRIGDFECFFVFENGGFVQKDFSFTPIMEREVNFFAYTVDESEKINITVHADTFWHEYPEFDENTLYYDIAIKPAHYETVKVLRAYRIPENFVLDENAYSITGTLDGGVTYYFEPSEECEIKIGKTDGGLDYVSYYENHYDWVYERTEDGGRTYKLYSGDYMVHALVRVSEEHVVLIKYRENEDKVSRIFKSIEKISFVSCEKENADERVGMENIEYTVDVSESLDRVAAIYDTYRVTFNIGVRSDWKTYSDGTDKNGFFSIDSKGHQSPRLLISGVYQVSSDYDLYESLKQYDWYYPVNAFLYGKTEKGYDYVISNYDHRGGGAYSAYVTMKISDELVLNLVYHYYEGEGWAEVAESLNMISLMSAEKNEGTERPKNAPTPKEAYDEYINAYRMNLWFGDIKFNYSYDDMIEIGGKEYVKCTDVESYAEFKEIMYSLFSKEIADKYIYSSFDVNGTTTMMYIEHNGQLYAYFGIEGPGGLFENGDNVTVVYESDTKIRLDIKYQLYSGFGAHRFMESDFLTMSYDYELIDGEWVFTNWPEYRNEIY